MIKTASQLNDYLIKHYRAETPEKKKLLNYREIGRKPTERSPA